MKLYVIGGGPGGYETAVAAAKKGLEVTLINDGELGGTCLNEGCIPTKSLVRWAGTGMTLAEIQQKKAEAVDTLKSGVEFLLKDVKVVRGKAKFTPSGNLEVTSEGATTTIEIADDDKIIIATGSKAAMLNVKGKERCITSTEMLQMTEAPDKLCVIGGGVIGLELASVFRRLGSEVTVLEYCKQILPRFDTDLAKRLKQALTKSGIIINTGYEVTDVNEIDADVVLMAVGRRPNLEDLGLETVGIEYSGRGIVVDEWMRTTRKNVYAIGDVTGGMMLAHVATAQGMHALNDIVGEEDRIRFDIVPAAVFTIPEVATVGQTEEELKEKGVEYVAHKSFYRANGKAVCMGETEGYCKLLADKATGLILGAHIMGAHSSDLIHEIAALMYKNGTTDDLKWMIHAHPTLSEVIKV